MLSQGEGAIRALQFSRDGMTLFSAGEYGYVSAWDVGSGRERIRFGHATLAPEASYGYAVMALALSPSGGILATQGGSGTITLWDAMRGDVIGRLKTTAEGLIALAFSPDGSRLADVECQTRGHAAARECMVRVRDLTGAVVAELPHSPEPVQWPRGLAFSPDGSQLAVAAYNIMLWNVATRSLVAVGRQAIEDPLFSVAFARDGGRVYAGGVGGGSYVWEPGLDVVRISAGHLLAPSPDARSVAVLEPDRALSLVDAATGKRVSLLASRIEPPRGYYPGAAPAAFSPDGTFFAVAEGSAIRLWDVRSQVELHPLAGRAPPVTTAALSPNDTVVAVGDTSGHVGFWDLASATECRHFAAHAGRVNLLRFTSDGQTLLTAGADGALRAWEPDTGAEIWALTGLALDIRPVLSDDTSALVFAELGEARVIETLGGRESARVRLPGHPARHHVRGLALARDRC
jgi:WD40 repeat protein